MAQAIALFDTPKVVGEVLLHQRKNGVVVKATFTKLPPGKHGFHIHKAGDLRGEGCKAACDRTASRSLSTTDCSRCCDHWHKGSSTVHGGPPSSEKQGPRHTGDLGNIELKGGPCEMEYFLRKVTIEELYGRSIIVHADEDDLGKGTEEDSQTTGHSGARIACAIIGRTLEGCLSKSTRKLK
jgi:Cu-Zn family superoxide dismutase